METYGCQRGITGGFATLGPSIRIVVRGRFEQIKGIVPLWNRYSNR